MGSCKPRGSFVKPHVEAPRQVIGFDLSPKAETIKPNYGGFDDLLPNSEIISRAQAEGLFESKTSPSPKLGASSPRSALQQLLLKPSNQSPPATSSPSVNQDLANGLMKPECPLQPASSPPSANQNLTRSLLKPSANQNCTGGIFQSVGQSHRASSPPSANQMKSSFLKCLVQSHRSSSESLVNQDLPTISSTSQSQCDSSSPSANQSSTSVKRKGSAIGFTNCNYEKISQIKHSNHEACPIRYEARERLDSLKAGKSSPRSQNEVKGAFIGVKEVINEHSCAGKSKKSSCKGGVLDEHQPYFAERSKKSSWMELQVQMDEHPAEKSKKSSWKEVINPGKSKQSSLFMFVVGSPAAENHPHHHHHHYHHHADKNLDFLNSCHLCRRLLSQGKDVFMYSGDKAFCSMECRYQQIVIDHERKERRAPPVIRSGAFQIMTSITAAAAATQHPIMVNAPPHFINTAAAA